MDVIELMKSRMGDDRREIKEKKRPTKRKWIEIALTGGDETLVVDFREISGRQKKTILDINSKNNPSSSTEVQPQPQQTFEDDDILDTNRITGVIRNIERMYTGELEYLDGYDMEDSFIDKSDAFTKESYQPKPTLQTKFGGFFINAGVLELVEKEQENEPEIIVPSQKNKMRVRTVDHSENHKHVQLDPETEKAIQRLSEVTPGEIRGNFPKELEPLLADVAYAAQASHPKGYITSDVLLRLTQILPFSAGTLKGKMKKLARGKKLEAEVFQQMELKENLLKEIEERVSAVVTTMNGRGEKPSRWQWDPETREKIWQVVKVTEQIVKLHNERLEWLQSNSIDSTTLSSIPNNTALTIPNTIPKIVPPTVPSNVSPNLSNPTPPLSTPNLSTNNNLGSSQTSSTTSHWGSLPKGPLKKRIEKHNLYDKLISFWPEGWMNNKKIQSATQTQQRKENILRKKEQEDEGKEKGKELDKENGTEKKKEGVNLETEKNQVETNFTGSQICNE